MPRDPVGDLASISSLLLGIVLERWDHRDAEGEKKSVAKNGIVCGWDTAEGGRDLIFSKCVPSVRNPIVTKLAYHGCPLCPAPEMPLPKKD